MERKKVPKFRKVRKLSKKEKRRLRRRELFRFARDSLEANINQFFDFFDTALAFRLLHVCYGLIMLALFYTIALHLIHHLEERRLKDIPLQTTETHQP